MDNTVNSLLNMNLQLLAEGEVKGGEPAPQTQQNNTAGGETGEPQEPEKKEKLFTQDELDKIISKKFAKWKEKETKEREEAERLAKLSEEERQKELFKKQVEEFEATKRAFAEEKLLNETTKQLASKKLPVEFAGMLKGKDAETTLNNINAFEAKFNEALENAVNNRLKGSTPKTSSTQSIEMTKEQFNKLGYKERMNLFNNNKELYDKLKG